MYLSNNEITECFAIVLNISLWQELLAQKLQQRIDILIKQLGNEGLGCNSFLIFYLRLFARSNHNLTP